MSDIITELAPAKVNLDLFVTGKREDGYHLLDSLVVFTDFGDRISVRAANDLSLEINGPYADAIPTDDSNLVMRAALALQTFAEVNQGAHIELEKNIPAAAGVGGGSADAAAAIKALIRLWGLSLDKAALMSLALSIGADVPVCMLSSPSIMRGVGENLSPLEGVPEFGMLLVNPGVDLSTPSVFKARSHTFSSVPDRKVFHNHLSRDEFVKNLSQQKNDLTDAAGHLAPVVHETLRMISDLDGCLLTRMSGSGATCFGLFSDLATAKQAESALSLRDTGWWIKACQININKN